MKAHRMVRFDFAYLFAVILALAALPAPAYAVLPPDMIFSLSSQLVQLYAVASAVILGAVLSIVPAFTAFFSNRWVRYGLAALGAIAIVVLWSFVLLSIARPNTPSIPESVAPTGTTTGAVAYETGHRFSSDRFVFVGTRANGDAVALEMSANRQEKSEGGFIHYYFADIADGDRVAHDYRTRLSPDDRIIGDLVFTSFSRTVAEDHSSRERFTFSFSGNDTRYSIQTGELQGDFITKNEPEYTMYASVAPATLTAGDEQIEGHFMFQRLYSSDDRPTIFFDGFDSLRSTAMQIVVWDESGSFYLVDKSDVETFSPSYSSHFWALTKNMSGSRKAFEGTFERRGKSFTGSIPSLGIEEISLSLRTAFTTENVGGYVSGEVTDAAGTRFVHGIVSYSEYGR